MRQLRIVVTADPEIPVPPLYYGGIERIVHMLVCGLTERGHEVHLFAHPESKTPAHLIPLKGRHSRSFVDTMNNAIQIKNYVKKLGNVDVIHSFSRLAYLLLLMRKTIPKIQSYQRPIAPRSVRLGNLLSGGKITFTACSRYCASTANFADGNWVIIPNGVQIEKYKFIPRVCEDAPLVFLGRIERIKGAHTAIEVAKRTNKHLLIAGNHALLGKDYEYFSKEVLPLCDGRVIKYIGPVDDNQKNELLGNASTLLFPIEWDEPFGIVMVEALACGTPVIAFARGAVSEVIKHKITGFICKSVDDMVEAIKCIPSIGRIRCRKEAEEYFSDKVITKTYEQLYYSCIQELTVFKN